MTTPSVPPTRPWRCIIINCTTPIDPAELFYCPLHRRLADEGVPAVELPRHTVPQTEES